MKTLFQTDPETGEIKANVFNGSKPHPQSEEIWLDFLSGKDNSLDQLAEKYNISDSAVSVIISKKFAQKKF